MPMLEDAYRRLKDDSSVWHGDLRFLELALTMGSLPNKYFQYYYFKDAILEELRNKPTTRAEDILAQVGGYWEHYREQAYTKKKSVLEPARSRGGIHELELSIDAMDAIFNDRKEGNRRDAIRALAANPLVVSLTQAEKIYDDFCVAHREYLPERLLNV